MERLPRVLVVMGSRRKGNTYRAAERLRVLMEARGPVEFEYLWLRDAHLLPCRGCAVCVAKGEEHCPNRDDLPAIVRRMDEADGVVLASPVYSWAVTGQFKVFVDRLSYVMHRPRFHNKKALVLTTAMFATKEVEDYLARVAQFWGFEVVARAGLITPPGEIPARQQEANERILASAAGSFSRALQSRRSSPGPREVLMFHCARALIDEQADDTPVDHRYWAERGWLDPGTRFYVDVPVNPVYSAIGRFVERQARRQIRRDHWP
jgi:multimeric flavodoxin WrbA